ncbi:hypothetical protein ElyMa_002103300 [Elysia marginata]|uniref:Uncharacterized protein n=1 Tax=Elysia marginata TaxID=1093978 RepID=A0AAV4FFS5_9GAST|nr:hypothetical protein ElyMa_002103300 [Elysia marginata]
MVFFSHGTAGSGFVSSVSCKIQYVEVSCLKFSLKCLFPTEEAALRRPYFGFRRSDHRLQWIKPKDAAFRPNEAIFMQQKRQTSRDACLCVVDG